MRRQRITSHGTSLLNYCITSNHTYLLLRVRETLSGFMQSLEGGFAQNYNRRKKRSGAF